jgi:signal transduction histidine kinase
VQLDIRQFKGPLDKDAEVSIFRIVQEGLNNILRHADAETARVTLLPENGSLLLVIDDNGKGLPEDPGEREYLLQTGFGLKGMAERVRILQGQMKLDSKPAKGTRIEIRIPIAQIVQQTVDTEIHDTA